MNLMNMCATFPSTKRRQGSLVVTPGNVDSRQRCVNPYLQQESAVQMIL